MKARRITAKTKKELRHLAKMDDSQIKYTDISELNFDELSKPAVGKFYRPLKKQINIRIDSD